MGVLRMERGETEQECQELTRDPQSALSAFWSSQLQRLKQRAENDVNKD